MEKEGYEDVDYWLKVAKRREEGVKKRKEEEKEKEEENHRKQLMFHRAEDNETGCVGARRRQPGNAAVQPQGEQEQEEQIDDQTQAHATAVTSSIYPGLPLQDPPPEYPTPPQTRSNKISLRWSRQYGRTFSPTLTHCPRVVPTAPKLSHDENPSLAKTYPMIQVANPNIGNNQPPALLVYRTWTMEDVKKAVEGVTSPREDPIQCGEDLESLKRSYHLNGEEVQQVWMTVTGTDWHHVRGNWKPYTQ
ncbi:hypothetical protein AMECASPLE_036651 [Ameca splendens]|uniref:Uncharacterized protein n=1 Tax=Ameca splendens TaxID=208324 RepID=A0ABV0ZU21_9TELE